MSHVHQGSSEDEYSPPEDNLNPKIVFPRKDALQLVPVTLIVDPPRSKEAQERIERLTEYARKGRRVEGTWDATKLQLTSTVLGNPLNDVWPNPDSDSDSEIEYELHETEEQWKAWKRKVEAIRATKAARKRLQNLDMTMAQGLTIEPPILSHPSRPIGSSQRAIDQTIVARRPDASYDDELAPVVDWNEDSIEQCFQSTPKRSTMVIQDNPLQLASPPDTGPERPLFTANGPAASPVRDDRQPVVPLVSPKSLSQHVHSIPPIPLQSTGATGNQRAPITPLSPNSPRLEQLHTNRPANDPPTLRSSARLRNSQTSIRREITSKGRVKGDATSPATTAFLYNSKAPSVRARRTQETEDTAGYLRELEEETSRLANDRVPETPMYVDQGSTRRLDEHPHRSTTPIHGHRRPRAGKNTITTTSPGTGRGTWDMGESFGGQSQETKAISILVYEDVGDVYRDEYGMFPRW